MLGQTPSRSTGIVIALLAIGLLSVDCSRRRSKSKSGPSTGAPVVSSANPDNGDMLGGTQITVFTSGFQDDFTADLPEVYLGGDPAAVSPLTATAVLAVTPPHPVSEAVDVEVRATGVTETATLVGGFTYVAITCTIGGITPNLGSVAGGQTVFIDGSGFDEPPLPPPTVEFGPGNPSPRVVALSGTLLEVDTPPGVTPGQVDVIISVQTGSCTYAAGYEYLPPGSCSVAAANPDLGFMDQTTMVTLTGAGFDPSPPPTVEFGPGNFGTVISVIGTSTLIVDAPTSPTPGLVDVIVKNQASQCTLTAGFEYLVPIPQPSCSISNLDPDFGPDFGGNTFVIYGTGFSATSRVWMGATEILLPVIRSDTEIQITAPPGVGSVNISVDIGGGVTCALPFGYTYVSCGGAPCNVQRSSPNSGYPGEPASIVGDMFEVGALVFFGNAPDLSQATVTDDAGAPTRLDVIVPPQVGPDPSVDIHVINPSGICCVKAGAFTYRGCYIGSMTPDQGSPVGGSTTMLRGAGFSVPPGGDVPEVWFGTEQCTYVVPWSATELVVQSPPAAGQSAVDVTVIYPSGDICTICCWTYFPGCSIDSIIPASGGTNGGDPLTITGWGFDTGPQPPLGSTPVIRFGSIQADPAFISVDPTGTRISVVAPPSFTGGPTDVEVFNVNPVSQCTAVGGYNYILPGVSACTITDIDPDSGDLQGGTRVTIRGDGFDAGTGILFGVVPGLQVTFISPQEMQVTTPSGSQLVLSGGAAPVDVVVAPEFSDPCIAPGGFIYKVPACYGACNLAGVSANSGPVGGGNTVTVSGFGLCDRAPEILFNWEPGQVTYVDDTTLSVVVPASVSGPGAVDVLYMDSTGCIAFCGGCYTYN